MFRRFEEAGSIRQVTLSLQQDRIDLPHLVNGPNGRIVEWRPSARYTRVYHVLTNPSTPVRTHWTDVFHGEGPKWQEGH